MQTAYSDFSAIKDSYVEALKAAANNDSNDWRYMKDETWEKILSGFDEYVEDYRNRLKEVQDKTLEAQAKAAGMADADSKANAVSNAAMMLAANGHADFYQKLLTQ